jgi:cytochrome c oxidase cbb3-type subunit 3
MCFRLRVELMLAGALLVGCYKGPPPAMPSDQSEGPKAIVSALSPGSDHSAVTSDPRAAAYYDNAEAVNTGRILFGGFNCSGCHSNGGGGMAPDLMDDEWIYGSRLEQIHDSIVQGRPNGMPAWGGKIPDQQIWQIAAYVRSMSLPQTLGAQNGSTPSQSPAPVPAAVDQTNGWPPPPKTTNDYTTTTKGPN